MRAFPALTAALFAALSLPAVAQLDQPGLSLGRDSDQGASSAARFGSGPYGTAPVDRNWRRGVFVGGLPEQGFNAARAGVFDQGFRPTPRLRGLPSAPRLGPVAEPGSAAATQTGASLGYRIDNFQLSSTLRQGFGNPGFGGTKLDLGASYGFNLTPRHLITLSGGLTLGQSSTAVPYASGLGAEGLTRWGYRMGEPGAGLRLSWLYSLDRNLYFNTTLGYDRAYGDAAEGLQGPERSAASLGTVFGYRW